MSIFSDALLMKPAIPLFLLLSFFTSIPIFPETPNETKTKALVEKYCPEPLQAGKIRIINAIFMKLSPQMAGEGAIILDDVLPQACFRNYPDWLMDRAINLAVYAYHDGRLQRPTLKYMNELIQSTSVGKVDYISYGMILENLLGAGLEKEYIFDIFHTALDESYNPTDTEALVYFYVKDALENRDHRRALQLALKESKPLRSRERTYVLNRLLNTEEEITKTAKEANSEKFKEELEEEYRNFWKKNKHKVKIQENFKKIKSPYTADQVRQFLTSRIGIPYGYRLNKNYGTDVNGMVGLITKSNIENLPFKYDSYCSGEKVGSIPSLKTGDVLLFSSDADRRETTALGIYLDHGEFLFVTISSGVTKSSLDDPYFKKSLLRGCRVIE